MGAHEVGMLRALAESSIEPDVILGTSIGAINGAMFAADPTVEATAVSVSCDRGLWLQEWCLNCRATPSAQCGMSSFSRTSQPTPLHVARGWRARTCPTYKALPGDLAATLDARLRTGIRRGSDRSGTSSRRASRCGKSSSARRDDHIGSIQRPRRPGWSRRQDHAAPARRRKAGGRRAVDRSRRTVLPAGAPVWIASVLRRAAPDRRDRRVDDSKIGAW